MIKVFLFIYFSNHSTEFFSLSKVVAALNSFTGHSLDPRPPGFSLSRRGQEDRAQDSVRSRVGTRSLLSSLIDWLEKSNLPSGKENEKDICLSRVTSGREQFSLESPHPALKVRRVQIHTAYVVWDSQEWTLIGSRNLAEGTINLFRDNPSIQSFQVFYR